LASGHCADPFNWIIEKQIQTFDRNPVAYDWKLVKVRSRAIEEEIIRRTVFDDEMARQERECATETNESFEHIFCSPRPAFDGMFANGTERPATFAEFARILQKPGGAFYSGYGIQFYARQASSEPDETRVREFAGRCPPFLLRL